MSEDIGEYKWRGEIMCWVDADGKPVSVEKESELRDRATKTDNEQMMERLGAARAIFYSMARGQERKAAFEWLRQTYNL